LSQGGTSVYIIHKRYINMTQLWWYTKMYMIPHDNKFYQEGPCGPGSQSPESLWPRYPRIIIYVEICSTKDHSCKVSLNIAKGVRTGEHLKMFLNFWLIVQIFTRQLFLNVAWQTCNVSINKIHKNEITS